MRAAFALRIFSGKFILNFGVLKCLRTFQNPFFTGRFGTNPLRRLRARFPLLSPMVTSSPGAGEVFPLRGSQAVSSVAKVSDIIRNLPATQKAPPFGGAGIEQSEMTERVYSCTFTMRKVFPRLMQSSSRSYSAGTSPMTFTFSSAGKSARTSWISPE